MYPAPFDYQAPTTLREALTLLRQHGDAARPLSGGHSLLPMMKLRLAQPQLLVDLKRIEGLRGIREEAGRLVIGAATTHWEIESSAALAARLPLLCEIASLIADPQVRNRGTIGGSLAHADPAADWPATALALDAELVCESLDGRRTVPAADWFQGLMTTALRPDELLVEVRLALPPAGTGAAYLKDPHPATRFALVGILALVTRGADGRCARARVAATGVATVQSRLAAVEAALEGQALDSAAIAAAAAHAAKGLDLQDDRHASASEKADLARVFTRRALTAAVAKLG